MVWFKTKEYKMVVTIVSMLKFLELERATLPLSEKQLAVFSPAGASLTHRMAVVQSDNVVYCEGTAPDGSTVSFYQGQLSEEILRSMSVILYSDCMRKAELDVKKNWARAEAEKLLARSGIVVR